MSLKSHFNYMENHIMNHDDPSPSAGVEISNEDEIVAAIKSTRGKFLMFSGDFGPSGLVGRIVTPNGKGEPRTEKGNHGN